MLVAERTRRGAGLGTQCRTWGAEAGQLFESLVESLPNRIKLGLAVSPKTLLKREDLTRIEKLRIVGDACFR